MQIELDPTEQRVVGSLLEKERTVPDTYPMTLNAVRTACNQSSGRDPVMAIGEHEVHTALDALRARGLTRVLHPSHGARMAKYRQVLDEVLTLDDGERAVLTVLLLRGAQTPGELRSRAERLHPFTSLVEVERALASLAAREDPLVQELGRRAGQKEQRWVHRLGPTPAPVADEPTLVGSTDIVSSEVTELRAQVAAAHAEIASLRQELDDLTAPGS